MSVFTTLPNLHVIENFLSKDLHAELLENTLKNEAAYKPSGLGRLDKDGKRQSAYDETTRKSTVRHLPTRLHERFHQSILGVLSDALGAINVHLPEEHRFEIEAVVSGDGALFKRHNDTGMKHKESYRVASAVYYYARQPKAFSGGALRIYALRGQEFRDIEPVDNSIVFFPSMFSHEVLPVSVPSGRFEDSRFSVNCWLRKVRQNDN